MSRAIQGIDTPGKHPHSLGTFLLTRTLGVFQDAVVGGNWRLPRREALGVTLAWEKGRLMSRRNSKSEYQECHGHLHGQGLPGNMLFELCRLLPGLPAMLRTIFSFSVRKEMAA